MRFDTHCKKKQGGLIMKKENNLIYCRASFYAFYSDGINLSFKLHSSAQNYIRYIILSVWKF